MRAGAAVTRHPNPYQAGLELGDALARLEPDLVLVFATGHYAGDTQIVEGLLDAIDRPELVVVGNAGDGFYSALDVSDHGASALGLRFGPETRLHVAQATGVAEDTGGAVRRVLDSLDTQLTDRARTHVFLQADARADAVELERCLASERRFPVFGGLVSDVHGLERATIFAHRERVLDGAVGLAIEGPTKIELRIANRFEWSGPVETIADAEGATLRRVSGVPASAFLEQAIRRPLLIPSSGVALFALVDDAGEPARVRGVVADYRDSAGALRLYGKVETGERLRIGHADPDTMIDDVRELGRAVAARDSRPVAGLILSCNGRRWALGERVAEEVRVLVDGLGSLPLAGFPTFAEIAPVTGAADAVPSAVHNMTYLLVLFGP